MVKVVKVKMVKIDFGTQIIIYEHESIESDESFCAQLFVRLVRFVFKKRTNMICVENNQECFVLLWRKLERTRRLLGGQCKRYCIRNVLKVWFGGEATDDFIWEVCRLCEQEGWNELPIPSLYPLKHRELLRAVVAVRLGISYYKKVNLKALDKAYSEAFPNSTQINKNKKKKRND